MRLEEQNFFYKPFTQRGFCQNINKPLKEHNEVLFKYHFPKMLKMKQIFEFSSVRVFRIFSTLKGLEAFAFSFFIVNAIIDLKSLRETIRIFYQGPLLQNFLRP